MSPTKFPISTGTGLSSENKLAQNNNNCFQCGKSLRTKKILKAHLLTHLKDGDRPKFKCSIDQCDKEYKSRPILKKHIKAFHLKTFKKIECNFCNLTFSSKVSRDNHIRTIHTLERAYKCKECPAHFPTEIHLRSHLLVHTEERTHNCTTCSKGFKTKSNLRRHTKAVHSVRVRAFSCSICSKKYFEKSKLMRHSLIHNQDGYRFSCYFCKMRFTERSILENHVRTHTQEKPFVCPVESCKYSCHKSSTLAYHMESQHSPTKAKYQCKIQSCYFCFKTLNSIQALGNHIRTHTQETPFRCGLCYKKFKVYQNLQNHILSHTMEKPYSCKECEKCFKFNVSLRHHIAAIHKNGK